MTPEGRNFLFRPSLKATMSINRKILEKYHAPEVVDLIIEQGDKIIAPRELEATILFIDIVGFTKIASNMTPLSVSHMLDIFFSAMSEIIFDYYGTLDKFIGDGLMAVFGAPIERSSDPERAVWTAIEMMNGLVPDNIQVRIGINTGRVVGGMVGTEKRMEYTVLGDAVNVASRLEQMALPGQILIGEETYKKVKDKFSIIEVGPKVIRGKDTRILTYEVRR